VIGRSVHAVYNALNKRGIYTHRHSNGFRINNL